MNSPTADADEQRTLLLTARDEWQAWTDREERLAQSGLGFYPNVVTGRAVVASLELEYATGVAHCACCRKPVGTHRYG